MTILLKEIFLIQILFFLIGCAPDAPPSTTINPVNNTTPNTTSTLSTSDIIVGADQIDLLKQKLGDKKIGVVVNPSSRVKGVHLVDTLKSEGINLVKIFAPEHGYRGEAEAGEYVKDKTDVKTQLPVFSLYGKNKKVPDNYFQDIDIIVFDLQDVGTRFYTYISTLHYVMEAAAKKGMKVIILDRPNPNGHYVDGPIKEEGVKAFVAMHPVPLVHGMTIGEYGKMINGEKWLTDGMQCNLEIITMKDYDRNMIYAPPVPPSPNLPNLKSILLYPSLCPFEGTVVSIGRGTPTPFQVYGHPDLKSGSYKFTPKPKHPGAWPPKLSEKNCVGKSFEGMSIDKMREQKFTLKHIIDAYNDYPDKENFFLATGYFDTLMGNKRVKKMIIAGNSENQIRATWQIELRAFMEVRKKYLIY